MKGRHWAVRIRLTTSLWDEFGGKPSASRLSLDDSLLCIGIGV